MTPPTILSLDYVIYETTCIFEVIDSLDNWTPEDMAYGQPPIIMENDILQSEDEAKDDQ